MFTPRASASTLSGLAYSRSIRSRTRRSSARSRRCCAAAVVLVTCEIVPWPAARTEATSWRLAECDHQLRRCGARLAAAVVLELKGRRVLGLVAQDETVVR